MQSDTAVILDEVWTNSVNPEKHITELYIQCTRKTELNNLENDIKNCKACTIIIVQSFQLFNTKKKIVIVVYL